MSTFVPLDFEIILQGNQVVLSTLEQISILCFDCFPLQSCHQRIDELFSDKIYLIGIAALVVAVIMVRTTTHHKNVKSLNNLVYFCPV